MAHPSVLTGVGVIGSRAKATTGTSTDTGVSAERPTYCLRLRQNCCQVKDSFGLSSSNLRAV